MTTENHSELPWIVDTETWMITTTHGEYIAEVYDYSELTADKDEDEEDPNNTEANAFFITQACNHYEDTLTLLKEALECLKASESAYFTDCRTRIESLLSIIKMEETILCTRHKTDCQ